MSKSVHSKISNSILTSILLLSMCSYAEENQLSGLLKFAYEYEKGKSQGATNENQAYIESQNGIQLPQLKVKMLNQQIHALSIKERQYQIKLQQKEQALLQAKMKKTTGDLLVLLNKKTFQLKLEQQKNLQEIIKENLAKSKNENLNLNNNIKLLSQRLENAEKEQKKTMEQMLTLQHPIPTEQLKNNAELKQAYAAGIAIGQDAMAIHKENQSFGQHMDKQAYLAGIIDAIEGRMLLSPTELQTALIASNSAVTQNRDAQKEAQNKLAKNFLSSWSKQKDVNTDPLGYSYKINYLGKGEIQPSDLISIVVKESLLDGTVVSDMDLQNKSLTLPLDSYPPLFQSVISHLENHGEITFVVPPELAYGDEGYPPSVPPGASLIYTLRISDVKSASSN